MHNAKIFHVFITPDRWTMVSANLGLDPRYWQINMQTGNAPV